MAYTPHWKKRQEDLKRRAQLAKNKVVKNKLKPKVKPVVKPVVPPFAGKWVSWEERLHAFDQVATALYKIENGHQLCLHDGVLGDVVKLAKRIGTESAYGEAYKAYLVQNGAVLAVKKVPLEQFDQGSFFTKEQLKSGRSAWSEIAAYTLCTVLMLAKVCNNLPFTYKYTTCDKCQFVNPRIKRKNRPCMLVVNEFADGDLNHYIKKRKDVWTLPLVDNCVFQMVAGLYALEKYYNMSHNDLHYGNVLVHEIKPGGYWQYHIDGLTYKVPNLGFVFVLWDLGMAHIPGKIKGRTTFDTLESKPIRGETDIGRICSILERPLGFLKSKLLRDMRKLEGMISLKTILSDYFPSYLNRSPPSGKLIDTFNMDFSIETLRDAHPPSMRRFLQSNEEFKRTTKRTKSLITFSDYSRM